MSDEAWPSFPANKRVLPALVALEDLKETRDFFFAPARFGSDGPTETLMSSSTVCEIKTRFLQFYAM
jgi:hypothetical protein